MAEDRPQPRMLDLRGLEPPAPMVEILKALEALEPGGQLEATLSRRPVFFIPILEEAGHGYALEEIGPEEWVLRITKA